MNGKRYNISTYNSYVKLVGVRGVQYGKRFKVRPKLLQTKARTIL